MKNNKLLKYFKTQEQFDTQTIYVEQGSMEDTFIDQNGEEQWGEPDIYPEHICFIEDTKTIFTHNTKYVCLPSDSGNCKKTTISDILKFYNDTTKTFDESYINDNGDVILLSDENGYLLATDILLEMLNDEYVIAYTLNEFDTRLKIVEVGGNLSQGTNISIDNNTISAVGYKYDSTKTSFTTGYATQANGEFSFAAGRDSKANGVCSHAEGEETEAVGDSSHAEGSSSHAEGNYSHAEGSSSHAQGVSSHAEGSSSHAEGPSSHAEGYLTHSQGTNSHTEGEYTETIGIASHAEGYKTTAFGKASHSEGNGVEAVGVASHAEGWHNIDSANSSIYIVKQDADDNTKYHIVSDYRGVTSESGEILYLKHGMTFLCDDEYYCVTEVFYDETNPDNPTSFKLNQSIGKTDTNDFKIKLVLGKSIGKASHTEGCNTVAYGDYSHAEGNTTRAAGSNSHTEGVETSAVGSASHAEGQSSVAIGDFSHAEGCNTSAAGIYSHTEGIRNTADGYASHAEGARNRVINSFEHAQGYFNVSNTGSKAENQTISSIGIGHYTGGTESPYNEELAVRKNALEVMRNGDIYINGIGDYDGTNAVNSNSEEKTGKSLQKVVEELSNYTIATTDEPGVIKVGENLTITEDGTLSASKCPTKFDELIYSIDGQTHKTLQLLYNGFIVQNDEEFNLCAGSDGMNMNTVFKEWYPYGASYTARGYWGYCDSIIGTSGEELTDSTTLINGTKKSGLPVFTKGGEPQDYILYDENWHENSGYFSRKKYSNYDTTVAVGCYLNNVSGGEDYIAQLIAMNCDIFKDETTNQLNYENAYGISLHTLNLYGTAGGDGIYCSRPNRAEFLNDDNTETIYGNGNPNFNSTIQISCFKQQNLNTDTDGDIIPVNGEINIPLLSFKEGLSIIPNLESTQSAAIQSRVKRENNIITIWLSNPYYIKNDNGEYVDDLDFEVKNNMPIIINLDNYTLTYTDNDGGIHTKDFSENAEQTPTWESTFKLNEQTIINYTENQIKWIREIFDSLKEEAYIGYETKSTGSAFFRYVKTSLNDITILRTDDKQVYIKEGDEFVQVPNTDIFKELKSGSRLVFNNVTGNLFYNDGVNIYQIASLSEGSSSLLKYNKERRSVCFQYNETDKSYNEANADYSFVIGYNNKAIREEPDEAGLTLQAANSFVGGENCRAYHSNSFVFGQGLVTTEGNQVVLGKYNTPLYWGNIRLTVGCGTDNDNKMNLLVLQEGTGLRIRGTCENGTNYIGDFGEYFEWLDGNPDNEDRIGYMVQLNGNKIELATSLKQCIGVISGTCSFLSGSCSLDWHGRFLRDKFGRYLKDENGNLIVNPDYNPELEYIPREQRKEWDVVGLIGQVITRQDGTLEVGGYAGCVNGIATNATSGFKVIKIIDSETALLLVK